MLTDASRKELEKQQYRIIGQHSAVKVCGWTKKMIKGEGGCYKFKFYGIHSNQCMQMTTSISCANRCTFCWRGYKAPVAKEWKWEVDDPDMIYEQSVKAHHKLLNGMKGNKKVTPGAYTQSTTVRHVALSLTGEPIIYPKMNELLHRFNRENVSTFLVTNAQYPDQIRDLAPVTQLYISLDAPTKELLKKIDVPLFKDYWERLNQSLAYMAKKNHRTTIRLTHVKGMNDGDVDKYAEMILKAKPSFIEIKGYMFVGASRQRLNKENMPFHEDVAQFAQEVVKFLPDYEIVSEHIPSRAILLAHKKFCIDGVWHTWIDFEKYHELVNNGKEFTDLDYVKKTPGKIGLTGEGTLTKMKQHIMTIDGEPA